MWPKISFLYLEPQEIKSHLSFQIISTGKMRELLSTTPISEKVLEAKLKNYMNDKNYHSFIRERIQYIVEDRQFDSIGVLDQEIPHLIRKLLDFVSPFHIENAFCIYKKNDQIVIEGNYNKNDNVLLFTPLSCSGRKILEICKLINQHDMKVKAVISLIDMLKGAKEYLRTNNYTLYTLLTLEDLKKEVFMTIQDIENKKEREALQEITPPIKNTQYILDEDSPSLGANLRRYLK
ncbi:MAG: hypothetical protein ACFFDN_06790 [Candidatus Hodarchaeota archaeon]